MDYLNDSRNVCMHTDTKNNLRILKGKEFKELFTSFVFVYFVMGDSGFDVVRYAIDGGVCFEVECHGNFYKFEIYY